MVVVVVVVGMKAIEVMVGVRGGSQVEGGCGGRLSGRTGGDGGRGGGCIGDGGGRQVVGDTIGEGVVPMAVMIVVAAIPRLLPVL